MRAPTPPCQRQLSNGMRKRRFVILRTFFSGAVNDKRMWNSNWRRRGAILVLSAGLMIVMMSMLAFSIDAGYMFTMKTELQRAIDSAALAAAGSLVDGEEVAGQRLVEYLIRNPVGSNGFTVEEDELDEQISRFMRKHADDLEVTVGHWDAEAIDPETGLLGRIVPAESIPSTVGVKMQYTNLPLFFAPIIGQNTFTVKSQSIAMYQPRDIVLVLDLSASMNDDSELGQMDALGQSAIEANIRQIWEQLGAKNYGNMGFRPDWVTIPGRELSANVTWRSNAVDVVATSNIQMVKLFYSNGGRQKFSTNASSGTWKGTGSYRGKRILKTKIKIDGQWETFNFYDNSHVRRGLALDGVAYPSDGSWDDYIEYARSHSNSMPWYDKDVDAAGYRCKFGALTLINFWNRNKPAKDETPDLWKTSQQPIQAVKDAVRVFLDYLAEVNTREGENVLDRVGVAIYNSADGDGDQELDLTYDFDTVNNLVLRRQAGHYHQMTNIGAGLHEATQHLNDYARPGAFKMIVLMTDGNANWYQGNWSNKAAREYVLDEAEEAAQKRYPILTISLGASADSELMENVAEITDGFHFNIPGGQTVQEYSQDLMEVFRTIAAHRPLKLVR